MSAAGVAGVPVPVVATRQEHDEIEAALAAEEAELVRKAQALERAVQKHKQQKAAAASAREEAEAQQRQEEEMQRWQASLRSEVESAVQRLNEQRLSQLERCAQFEDALQANISQMQGTLHQVRRRAAALDTAFDACVQRLSTAYVDAVAARRQDAASQLGAA